MQLVRLVLSYMTFIPASGPKSDALQYMQKHMLQFLKALKLKTGMTLRNQAKLGISEDG